MTQANAPTPAVIVHVNGRKARWQSLLFGAMTLLFALPTGAAILSGRWSEFPSVFGLLITAIFGALALTFLGLSLRKPVALRMDAHGISGWYTAPATWDEIASVSVLGGPNETPLLAFALHDPLPFRDRQSPWQRLTSHANGRNNGHHIVISQSLLEGTTAAQLAPLAEQFRTAKDTPA